MGQKDLLDVRLDPFIHGDPIAGRFQDDLRRAFEGLKEPLDDQGIVGQSLLLVDVPLAIHDDDVVPLQPNV